MQIKHAIVLRNRHFFIMDIITIVAACFFSFFIRLEFMLSTAQLQGAALFVCMALPVQLGIFTTCGMYSRYWYNAGTSELLLVAQSCILAGLATSGAALLIWSVAPSLQESLPRSIPIIEAGILALFVAASRFSQRAYQHRRRSFRHSSASDASERILIVGAGHTGIQVVESLIRNTKATVAGFLDDDLDKVHTWVHGTRVIGKLSELRGAVQQHTITLVIVAMPSAAGDVIRRIVQDCRTLGVNYKSIPSMNDLVSGKISLNTLRPISIDDLLRRPAVNLDVADVQRQVCGACVMITGAGGSIGSELARQIAKHHPAQLLLVGRGENSLFAVEAQLKAEFPHATFQLLLADVRDLKRMDSIFGQWHPKIVFHAAAHKHVPMLEANPIEAIINNVIGTNNLIELCIRHRVERMVMISTDKAVSPTNIMGMTKRVTEMLMINAAIRNPGRFVAVRFGNVLGSRGSVVPTFQKQIDAGGPITITSDSITRFFMSIPEAARLVLKASVMQEFGSLFVLNMGEPIRILDLAHDMIRLSGLQPESDIEIKITGLRPGEKLHEELFWPYERSQAIEKGALFTVQIQEDIQKMVTQQLEQIHVLMREAQNNNTAIVRELLPTIVFALPETAKTLLPEKAAFAMLHPAQLSGQV